MRDENRIDKMCELLRQTWHLVPDWRLGQLVVNISKSCKSLDTFYVEDEEFERVMKDWLKYDEMKG